MLIIKSRFYAAIADELLRGAVAALDAAGAEHVIVSVPGALEIADRARHGSQGSGSV